MINLAEIDAAASRASEALDHVIKLGANVRHAFFEPGIETWGVSLEGGVEGDSAGVIPAHVLIVPDDVFRLEQSREIPREQAVQRSQRRDTPVERTRGRSAKAAFKLEGDLTIAAQGNDFCLHRVCPSNTPQTTTVFRCVQYARRQG